MVSKRNRSHKGRLGQHILTDGSVLNAILEAAEIGKEDLVVEIGAGTGVLTEAIAKRAKHLTALELDEGLCSLLKLKLGHLKNLTIINADALAFDYGNPALRGASPYKVIGNLPYYIATPLLMRLLEYRQFIKDMTLMFQEEVARRLTAFPGNKDYGALTIKTQYYAEAVKCFTVSPAAFSPRPKVNSALVKITILERPRVAPEDTELFFAIVNAAFAHRRKTIKNSLKAALTHILDEKTIERALRETGIGRDVRGEKLGIKDFLNLSDRITELSRR